MFGGAMDEFFAPGRRHIDEERRRQEVTLDEVGDADSGRGPIDLGSGTVLMRLPAPEEGGDGADTGESVESADQRAP